MSRTRERCAELSFFFLLALGACVVVPPTPSDDIDDPAGADAGVVIVDPPPVDSATAERLQAALDAERAEQRSVGMGAAMFIPGQGLWTGASGTDRPFGRAIAPTDRHQIGSTSKTFTAVLIFQQIDKGALSFDSPLSTWFPSVRNSSQIRIRHMLSHTSGIPEFLADPVANDYGAPVDHATFAERIAALGSNFEPGTRHDYSNSNYILLGLVIEEVTGSNYVDLVRDGITAPVGMPDTKLAGYEDIPGGYLGGNLFENGAYRLLPTIDPSWTWAAGGVVSTVRDVQRFFEALLGGELVSADSLEKMRDMRFDINAGVNYGHGLFQMDSPWGPFLFHDGYLDETSSVGGVFTDSGVRFAGYANTSPADWLAIVDRHMAVISP